jgi:hypothetical protein
MGDDSVLHAFVRLEPWTKWIGIKDGNGIAIRKEISVQNSAEKRVLKTGRD